MQAVNTAMVQTYWQVGREIVEEEQRGADRAGVRFDELTTSENVCRNGLAFATLHELLPGASLEIEIDQAARATEREAAGFTTRGDVAHVAPAADTNQFIVGVKFTGPRFHRVFRPESD